MHLQFGIRTLLFLMLMVAVSLAIPRTWISGFLGLVCVASPLVFLILEFSVRSISRNRDNFSLGSKARLFPEDEEAHLDFRQSDAIDLPSRRTGGDTDGEQPPKTF